VLLCLKISSINEKNWRKYLNEMSGKMEAILRLKKTNILTIYLNIDNDVSDCTYILKQSVVVVVFVIQLFQFFIFF
jgi:hypothetical protein